MNITASKLLPMWKPAVHRDHIRLHVLICGFENMVLVDLGFPGGDQSMQTYFMQYCYIIIGIMKAKI